jgi:hypothetical protein
VPTPALCGASNEVPHRQLKTLRSCRVQCINDQEPPLSARPILQDIEEIMFQSKIVAEGAETTCVQATDRQEDEVTTLCLNELRKIMHGPGLAGARLAHDE